MFYPDPSAAAAAVFKYLFYGLNYIYKSGTTRDTMQPIIKLYINNLCNITCCSSLSLLLWELLCVPALKLSLMLPVGFMGKRCLLGPKLLTRACSRGPLISCQWRDPPWVIRTAECSLAVVDQGAWTESGIKDWARVQALLLHDPLNSQWGSLWAALERPDKLHTAQW